MASIKQILGMMRATLCGCQFSELRHPDYDTAIHCGKPRPYSTQTVKPRSKRQRLSVVLSNRSNHRLGREWRRGHSLAQNHLVNSSPRIPSPPPLPILIHPPTRTGKCLRQHQQRHRKHNSDFGWQHFSKPPGRDHIHHDGRRDGRQRHL